MLMRFALLTALLGIGVSAHAQAPVTVAEADAVFQRIDKAISDVLKIKPAEKKPFGPNRAITRSEVVERMDVLFKRYKPHFQYTPRPYRYEVDVIKQYNKDAETQKTIEKLAKWGFLAPVGPVVTGSEPSLSLTEFADAVGYFMSQTAALTYFADPKWVPNLQPPVSGGG